MSRLEGFDLLSELALNLRWSWNHATDAIWLRLDPELWQSTHNPWVVLQSVSKEAVERLLEEPDFRRSVDELVNTRKRKFEAPAWFQETHADSSLNLVAYFSMEFMLSEALPIYSGGLGNVAGDQLKAASDLGVPVAGVGLLYQQGYFRQVIDSQGAQQAFYPYNDPGQLPITPLRKADGEWLRLEIELPGYSVWLRAWQVAVGRVKLYLLDSNDAANYPAHRGITSELYGGDAELRLQQELLLGIGGWRLLRALGFNPDVCHLNEGHAAFAVLERARDCMDETGLPFHEALAVTRAGNLFTTHTAVAAGFDRFPPSLIDRYLGAYSGNKLGLPIKDLLALGRQNPEDASEPFNMAYLAIRGCGAVSAVSRLHGAVSREIFQPLFPGWPREEVPVGYVTNGVHTPTWDSAEADELWTEACGKNRWLGTNSNLERDIRGVSDFKLWNFRNVSRKGLVDFARKRLSLELAVSGAPPEDVEAAKHLFDPDALTLGFARRFATYKRPDLLLHDPPRLLRLLSDSKRPVQLIIAGKAHPADGDGQALIQKWVKFIRRPDARPHAIFLGDYDMRLTQQLVQGVDVWINTPRRPWEACGTSGMKVLVNGGINLSELDGWWAEAYSPEVGWALGDGKEHGDAQQLDDIEADTLYRLLENEVVPEFYSRNAERLPIAWLRRMRESMALLTPQFSASRAVIEYTERHYIPSATAYRDRSAEKGCLGKLLAEWRRALQRDWPTLRIGETRPARKQDQIAFEVDIFPGAVNINSVRVELYADGLNGGRPELIAMASARPIDSGFVFVVDIPAKRPASDYTPRVIPEHSGANVPLEAAWILWGRR